MSVKHGKSELSFRRQKDSSTISNTATISSDIFFADQTVGGETKIDLTSLTVPSTFNGFSNPSLTILKSANIKKNANNLIIISSAKGTLQPNADYVVATPTAINLNFVALANEVFTFQLRATESTAEVVSGAPYVCTGTLTAGAVDVPIGQAFNINANSLQQIGEFMVLVDGVQQFRNVSNATAALGADGNYEEVSGGGAGLTNVVRFNEPFSLIEDVAVTIVSLGPILDSNYTGANQRVESLEGKIDQMIPTLAGLAGVPETDFQATPTNVDLKAFANKLYQACKDIIVNATQIAINTSIITALNSRLWNQANFYQEESVNLNGDFSAGTIKVARIGSMITVSCVGAQTTCTNQPSPATNAIVPSWARPPNSQGTLYYSDANGNYRMTVLSSGVIAFDFRNHSGTGLNRTNAFNNWTISYAI